MWPFDKIRGFYSKIKAKPLDEAAVERAFGVTPAASRAMKKGINLWYDLYTNNPPWRGDDPRLKPSGLPGAIGRELARNALAEFNVSISGGERAEYLNEQLQTAASAFGKDLELGLCLGGIALRPYMERGQLFVDANSATAFSPIEFDGNGQAVAGVFKETSTVNKQAYTRLEYHGFEYTEDGSSVYVIRNKAYKGDGGAGQEVSLDTVPKWADLQPEMRIENLQRPLFAYFKNPSSNDIDPDSQLGVSVYGGEPNVELLRQAEEQWYWLRWEFKSGKRKIYSDGGALNASQFDDELFMRGKFTADGNLFDTFSPEFRQDALYKGFQWILQRLEYNVGLSFGTISDPQSVERTATEILAAKNRQRITVKAIQNAFEAALDTLIYALDVYATLYRDQLGAPPAGEYEVTYNWGDGVLDDPETIRKDKAMDMQEVEAGIMQPYEYRMKWKKEDEATARAMLPGMEQLIETPVTMPAGIYQNEVE